MTWLFSCGFPFAALITENERKQMKPANKIRNLRRNLTAAMILFAILSPTISAQTFNLLSVKTGDKVSQSRLFFVDSEKVINTYDVNAPASPVQKISDSILTVGAVHNAMSSNHSTHNDMPWSYSLEQNFPNPFNPSTTIRYAVSNNAKVSILLHDMTGKEISTLVSENKSAGSYDLRWNGTSSDGHKLSSGTYFYTMVVENENGLVHKETRKMSMVK